MGTPVVKNMQVRTMNEYIPKVEDCAREGVERWVVDEGGERGDEEQYNVLHGPH